MPYPFDEPNMSDTTLLVSVEDLINIGLGPPDVNIVNFKVIQTVLHILARQQRMLKQLVEIRITERRRESSRPSTPRAKSKKVKETEVSESSSPKSSRTPSPKKRMAEIKEEREEKTRGKAEKKSEKDTLKAEKEKIKEEKGTSKADKEKTKDEKDARKAEKDKARAEKEAQKEKEKELKALEQADKSARREKEKAEKAQQKELEKAQKDKEKADKAAAKEQGKADKSATKEQEKAEKAAAKEQERAEKAAAKEKERAEKAERREKERDEKEAARAQKEIERMERSPSPAVKTKGLKKAPVESVSSISIKEVERDKGTVLVVEKGPTTRSESRARGPSASIDVVTQSQFALLEAAVRELAERAAPLGQLRLPDNQTLRGDLAKGSASLTDTMQAMQVNARVQAAEEALERMAGMLTQLAAAGALPPHAAAELRQVAPDTDVDVAIKARPSTARKSVAIDPAAKWSETGPPLSARPSTASARASVSTVMGRASVVSQPSSTVTTAPEPGVTRDEMEVLIKAVKDDLWKSMNSMTNKASAAAETALHTAKAVADKLDVAVKLDNRISSLYSLVADYAEQLSGFDAGLTTQMQSFQEQIAQIRSDLNGGLKLLESVNNNAETAAVMELRERYEELAAELERTLVAHAALNTFHSQLADQLQSLVECIEMLREQKADRDEVIDGLRDKADRRRLAGLAPGARLAAARAQLAARLDACYDKFHRQDAIWMACIKDLLKTTDLKAELIDLLSMKEDTQRQLQELHDQLKLLAIALGEPKAALLTRRLAAGAVCGACGAAALMPPADPAAGQPPPLPALRPPSPPPPAAAAAPPCLADAVLDERHMCQRWCGGSHTLLGAPPILLREAAPPLVIDEAPTRRFADYGLDGRLYMMEEELQPCVECNELLQERPAPLGEDGAGDHERRTTTIVQVIKE